MHQKCSLSTSLRDTRYFFNRVGFLPKLRYYTTGPQAFTKGTVPLRAQLETKGGPTGE